MNYTAYGQIIKSDFILPLPAGSSTGKAGLTIFSDKLTEPHDLCRTWDGVYYHHGENNLFIKWEQLGSYNVLNGKKIIVDPNPGISPSDTKMTVPLLGTISAIALHQQGLAVLHGGAVLINDQAVLFLGDKGEGKSTMIGFLMKQRFPVISDDICPISFRPGTSASILPSFPKIKLWPNSMEYLGRDPEKYERVHPDFSKRNISIGESFFNEATRVKKIIVLATAPEVKFEQIKGLNAIKEIMPHMIINRFADKQPKSLQSSVYSQLTNIVKNIPVRKLTRPRDLELLPALAEIIADTETYVI